MSFKSLELVEVTFIEVNMNTKEHIRIGRDNLFNSALKLEITDSCHFEQDNDLKHKKNVTKLWYNVKK